MVSDMVDNSNMGWINITIVIRKDQKWSVWLLTMLSD